MVPGTDYSEMCVNFLKKSDQQRVSDPTFKYTATCLQMAGTYVAGTKDRSRKTFLRKRVKYLTFCKFTKAYDYMKPGARSLKQGSLAPG